MSPGYFRRFAGRAGPIVVVLAAACLAQAQTLNFDVNSGTSGNYTGVGIVPGDTGTTWNALGLNGTQSSVSLAAGAVKNSAGAVLDNVAITLAHSDGVSAIKRFSTTGNSAPNPVALMQDYAYGATFNVTVSGLVPGSYGLWFFGHGDVSTQIGSVAVDAANGGGTGSTASSALGRDLINGGAGVSYVYLANRTVGADGVFKFQPSAYFNGFQLSRVPGPAITAQPPATPSVLVGGNVTLSVTAAGDGALTYQWRKAGAPLSDGPTGNGSACSGAATSALTLQNAQPGDAGDYSVLVTCSGVSLGSGTAALSVVSSDAPVFTSSPLSQTLSVGEAVTLNATVTSGGPVTYQWQKSTDNGATFADISGATSTTYALPKGKMSAAGKYRLVATNAGGSTTSAVATITVVAAYAPLAPDGFAASVTGGGNLTPVVVTTVSAFKSLAESTSPAVITISGTLNLGGNVRVKSNKTIQGIDADSGLIGNVLLSGVSNVVLRGLNFTHPGTTIGADGKYTDGGDGVSVDNSTRVLVTHCTFIDCADGMIDTRLGSTDVTISWCKLYYTSATTPHHFTMIADGNLIRDAVTDEVIAAGTPLRMTMHHNWWADYCDQRMPSSTNGRIHMFNNYWNTPGNYYAALARSGTEFISEQNRYVGVGNPLSKSVTDADLANPLIRSIGNSYSSCTGTIDAGTDVVFTPTYSYPLNPAANVAASVIASAGNTAGAASTHATPTTGSATITGPAIVGPGGSATLVAAPTGFTPLSYQWRFKNMNVPGATGPTLQIASAQTANAGAYSVVLGLSGGETIVSSGFTLDVVAGAPVITTQPSSQSVAAGQTATFTVVATGDPAPTYQWYKAGNPISGATASTYTITGAQTTHAGDYTVRVTNSITSTTSVIATLTVTDPYAAYLSNHGLDPAGNGAPAADPDNDGVPNRLEFFLGRSPTASDAPDTLPALRVDSGPSSAPVFEFRRAKAAETTPYAVEYSASLSAPWTTAVSGTDGVSIETTPIDAQFDRISVRFTAAGPKLFVRLKL